MRDRKRLCEMYPDLVEMVPFYLPIYSDSPRPWWIMRMGLGFYDLFSRQPEYNCQRVGNEEFLKSFPGVKEEGLRRVYVYYDGKTDDLELTRRLARDAQEYGCVVKEKCEVDKILINASGPWIDEVNDRYGLPHNYRISKVSGIHIVINQKLVPDCMFLQTPGRRIFFMIPWNEDTTIIGTTERMENCGCGEVGIWDEDIDYLLDCANSYLKTPIGRQDIDSFWE